MAVNFPGSLDTSTQLPQPSAGQFTNSPSHAGAHDNESLAIIAVETKLGTGASTPSGSNLLISTGTGTSAWSKTAPTGTIVGTSDTQTLTNKTLTSPTINAPSITNATITADAVSGFTTSNSGTIYGIGISSGQISGANTINGSALVAASVGSTALATNAVQGSQLAATAITLGYAQITTSFSTTSTTATQITGLTATVTIPSGGRRVRITAWADCTYNSSAGYNTISIWDGTVGSGTQLAASEMQITGANVQVAAITLASVVPSAGSKTYNVGLMVNTGTGFYRATSVSPAFILVELI